MAKTQLGPKTWVYPMPAFLIGAMVDGKPNFMTAAWCTIANARPPMIAVAIRHGRHTGQGIKQHGAFSVNVPSEDLVRETDYCGVVSGSTADKVEVCNFTVFYGQLKNVPLIEQCPMNLECTVVQTLDLGSNQLFIGEIVETHITDSCLVDGKPDVVQIKPIIYSTGVPHYYGFGRVLADAFSVGHELETQD